MIDSDIDAGGDDLVYFPSDCNEGANILGGKGYSLVRLSQLDLNVPSGAILTRHFFEPWYRRLRSGNTWQLLANNNNPNWEDIADALIVEAKHLTYSPQQITTIESLQNKLTTGFPGQLFAVRSSAPDEDGEGASFAGGYESQLGVTLEGLGQAIKACFLSSLSARAFAYKQQQGLDYLSPAFAVVVQRQINSDAAGVGFSLNPINNDYDEVLINANWGLGESVVSGEVAPDQFTVDKVNGKLVDKRLGGKAVSYCLDPDGGLRKAVNQGPAQYSLSDRQVLELTTLIARIENHYAKPVDIEWALYRNELFTLQARPITAYVPLPPELQTKPGEPRRLYADVMLSNGYTMNTPCSPLEMSCANAIFSSALHPLTGHNPAPDNALIIGAGCRAYSNLSPILRWISPKRLAKSDKGTEVLLSKIFLGVDRQKYKAQQRPPWLGWRAISMIGRLLWRYKGVLLLQPLGLIFGKQERCRLLLKEVEQIEQDARGGYDDRINLRDFRHRVTESTIADLFGPTGTLLMAVIMAQALVMNIAGKNPKRRELAEKLLRGYPDNVVVQMGILMHKIARQLRAHYIEDSDRLADKIASRNMPTEFLTLWDEFIERFGCRGPNEMDCANPRYGDDMQLALRQILPMVNSDGKNDPEQTLKRQVRERREAYQALLQEFGWFKRWLLRRCYYVIDGFAGLRDLPKYHIVLGTYAFKQRAVKEGEKLVYEGRLHQPEQIFGLTLDDIELAQTEPTLDLRQRYRERMQFYWQAQRQVKVFPSVIDSRGRILRPVLDPDKPGTLVGEGFSPGVVTGPVKTLNRPDEKPISKGDILVAYTTDPGWTPLFINAAAVVLEIGGVLQHGVVVAREYGLPCVAGIDQVMNKVNDGQIIEVDGTTGVIRFVE